MNAPITSQQRELANQAPIVHLLAAVNVQPQKPPTDHNWWYCSPIRGGDSEASFHVDAGTNWWYDFGIDEGGTAIDLLMRLKPEWSYPTIVRYLHTFVSAGAAIGSSTDSAPAKRAPAPPTFYDIQLAPLTDAKHLTYLAQRGIPTLELLRANAAVAQHLKQATYRTKNKPHTYSSLAWLNDGGGMTLKGPTFEGVVKCDGPYHTLLPGTAGTKADLVIVEGFTDALALLTAKTRTCVMGPDLLVLNSTRNAGNAVDLARGYTKCWLYLDNDEAGTLCTEFWRLHHPNVVDNRGLFANHLDVNDWLLDIPLAQREAEKAATKAAKAPKKPDDASNAHLRDTAKWWLAVKWAPGMEKASESGEVFEWMRYYSFTNELPSLNELKQLRSRLAAEKRIVVSRLCVRLPGKNARGLSNYKVLEPLFHG